MRAAAAQMASAVPDVDLTAYIVPLDGVTFDTFQPGNRQLPLPEVSPQQILALRDAIPPLHFPRYETVAEATWMRDGDPVVGYSDADEAWAYPTRILDLHEIVNDRLGGRPVLISFYPLCFSAVVFDRRLGGRELVFGNTSALYQSDMVMLDYQTGSYWWQVAGQAIVGTLSGQSMEPLPSITTTWQEWRTAHPHTLVLSRDTGLGSDYQGSSFDGYAAFLDSDRFAFPVDPELVDTRLRASTKVVGYGDRVTAFVPAATERGAINASVAGRPIVVLTEPRGPSGAVFDRTDGPASMTFTVRDDRYVDEATGSVWSFAGRAESGPLAGTQLQPVASTTALWFSAATVHPGIELHQP